MRALLGTTVLAAVLLSGCGNSTKPPANVAIAGKLAIDGSSGLPLATGPQLDCVAGVLERYVKASDLRDYVAGTRPFVDLRTSDNVRTQSGVNSCLGI